jgi:ABC-2 type transport system ATP-binding protein
MVATLDKDTILAIESLTKRYGSVPAINAISMTVAQGEVVGLIGPNGAGKTTILKCLAGLIKSYSGSILVNGVDARAARQRNDLLSFLFEIDALPNDMLVKNFLISEAYALGLGKPAVDEAISKASLTELQNKTIRTLSMGNRRRVGIAATLLPDSDLLILDEPTNGLDIEGLRLIRDLISDKKKNGKSVLFSSHTMSEVEKAVDRVVVICKGEKLFEGELETLRQTSGKSSLEEAYEQMLLGRA